MQSLGSMARVGTAQAAAVACRQSNTGVTSYSVMLLQTGISLLDMFQAQDVNHMADALVGEA